jgi:ureidoglycolate lyase
MVTQLESGLKSISIAVLERHPFSSQSFIPMGGSSDISYIVIVADSNEDDTAPDLATIKAYTEQGDEGVCYGAGLWHAPMTVIGAVSLTLSRLRLR